MSAAATAKQKLSTRFQPQRKVGDNDEDDNDDIRMMMTTIIIIIMTMITMLSTGFQPQRKVGQMIIMIPIIMMIMIHVVMITIIKKQYIHYNHQGPAPDSVIKWRRRRGQFSSEEG